jgi:cell division protease FtsH
MDMTEWGKSLMEQQNISQDMQAKIDVEIKKLVDEGHRKAVESVKKHKAKLDLIAEQLIKKETIEMEEFEALMGGPKKRPN